jgi:hypothetical protein
MYFHERPLHGRSRATTSLIEIGQDLSETKAWDALPNVLFKENCNALNSILRLRKE